MGLLILLVGIIDGVVDIRSFDGREKGSLDVSCLVGDFPSIEEVELAEDDVSWRGNTRSNIMAILGSIWNLFRSCCNRDSFSTVNRPTYRSGLAMKEGAILEKNEAKIVQLPQYNTGI